MATSIGTISLPHSRSNSVWEPYTVTNELREKRKYVFDVFLHNIIPVSQAKPKRSLESELRKRMDFLEFRKHNCVTELRDARREVYDNEEFVLTFLAPIVVLAECFVRLVVSQRFQRSRNILACFRCLH